MSEEIERILKEIVGDKSSASWLKGLKKLNNPNILLDNYDHYVVSIINELSQDGRKGWSAYYVEKNKYAEIKNFWEYFMDYHNKKIESALKINEFAVKQVILGNYCYV